MNIELKFDFWRIQIRLYLEIEMFLPLEHKIHISSQPSNILYIFSQPFNVLFIILTYSEWQKYTQIKDDM
jgi:hypothetical protein